jgi:hypothetical protein
MQSPDFFARKSEPPNEHSATKTPKRATFSRIGWTLRIAGALVMLWAAFGHVAFVTVLWALNIETPGPIGVLLVLTIEHPVAVFFGGLLSVAVGELVCRLGARDFTTHSEINMRK